MDWHGCCVGLQLEDSFFSVEKPVKQQDKLANPVKHYEYDDANDDS